MDIYDYWLNFERHTYIYIYIYIHICIYLPRLFEHIGGYKNLYTAPTLCFMLLDGAANWMSPELSGRVIYLEKSSFTDKATVRQDPHYFRCLWSGSAFSHGKTDIALGYHMINFRFVGWLRLPSTRRTPSPSASSAPIWSTLSTFTSGTISDSAIIFSQQTGSLIKKCIFRFGCEFSVLCDTCPNYSEIREIYQR